jgi:hypothetical protein
MGDLLEVRERLRETEENEEILNVGQYGPLLDTLTSPFPEQTRNYNYN